MQKIAYKASCGVAVANKSALSSDVSSAAWWLRICNAMHRHEKCGTPSDELAEISRSVSMIEFGEQRNNTIRGEKA